MSLLAALALLLAGSPLQNVWRLNPQAQVGLAALGSGATLLMLVVSVACGLSAVGLWRGTTWGRAAALTVLAVNLLGDAGNAIVGGDLRTLIGVPIGGALIVYIVLNRRVRAYFAPRPRSLTGA